MLIFIDRVSLSCFLKSFILGKISPQGVNRLFFGSKKKAGKLVPACLSYVDLYEGY